MGFQHEVETPNNTGYLEPLRFETGVSYGCFSTSDVHLNIDQLSGGVSNVYGQSRFNFSLSEGNSIYSGSIVQPNALLTLACIRT